MREDQGLPLWCSEGWGRSRTYSATTEYPRPLATTAAMLILKGLLGFAKGYTDVHDPGLSVG